jgi:hypothetical protein
MTNLFLSRLDQHFDFVNQCLGLLFMAFNAVSFIAFFIDDTFVNIFDQLLKLNAAALGLSLFYFIIQKQMNGSLRSDVGNIQTNIGALETTTERNFSNLTSNMERGFTNLNTNMERGFTNLNVNMERGFTNLNVNMEQGFTKLDSRLDRIEQILLSIDTTLKKMVPA